MKVTETLLAGAVTTLAAFVLLQSRTPVERGAAAAAGTLELAAASAATNAVPTPSGSEGPATRAVNGRATTLAGGRTDGRPGGRAAGRPGEALSTGRSEGRLAGRTEYVRDVPREPAWSAADMRRRLAEGATGTYISSLLTARDSVLTRWPDRRLTPLRVWVGDGGEHEGWSPVFPGVVRDAFDQWSATGIPVRFTFVRDSAGADVHFTFVPRFDEGISGRTIWSRDSEWWLVGGDVQLAITHPNGGGVSESQLRAIALHEVGHLLGLDHVDDATHIMAPRVRTRVLSDADVATIRLVYSVPAGPVRD